MPLPQETVLPTSFDYLQQNISLQAGQFSLAAELSYSGLQHVVLLQAVTPEVDLVNPFANHFSQMESLDNAAYFTQIVSTLNGHVVRRGTNPVTNESLSQRLNRWLWCNGLLVTRTYANLSSGAGWYIDECNIEAPNTCGPTSPYYGLPYPGCPPTPGQPIPDEP